MKKILSFITGIDYYSNNHDIHASGIHLEKNKYQFPLLKIEFE